jgi:hypothetical protein
MKTDKENVECGIVEDKGRFTVSYFDVTASINLIKQATRKDTLNEVLAKYGTISPFEQFTSFQKWLEKEVKK